MKLLGVGILIWMAILTLGLLTFAKVWTVQWAKSTGEHPYGPFWHTDKSVKTTFWAARRILKNRRGAYSDLMYRIWMRRT